MNRFIVLLPAIVLILFEIAIGVLLLVNPIDFIKWVIFGIGILLLILSVVFLVSFIRARKAHESALGAEIGSIICFLIGIFGVVFSQTEGVFLLIETFYIVFGIILFVVGVNKIIRFVIEKRTDNQLSWLVILSGIVAIALGIVIVFFPKSAADVVWTVSGIGLLAEALFDIIAVIHSAVMMKNVKMVTVTVESED